MRNPTALCLHPTLMMTRGLLPVLAMSVSAITSLLGAQSPAELADAFARMDKTAQQFKSVKGDFKRVVHTAVINDDAPDSGNIKVRRDKGHETRMLFELTAPDRKVVSIDGTALKVYTPKLKSVQFYDLGTKRNLIDEFLLLGFGASSAELKETYDVSLLGAENVGSESSWHLQLVPKSADVLKNLKKAELWIAQTSGLPIQQKFITSSAGDYMLVTYANMQMNISLPDSALKLTYPKGVTEEHPKL
jgi:outer membrane lipoprotein-sorting protein